MRVVLTVVLTLLSFSLTGHAEAAARRQFVVTASNGDVLVEAFSSSSGPARPAVVVLSGSKGFASPAYDELGRRLEATGLDAYLVHVLSASDVATIAGAGNARARIGYYAARLPDWIASVREVVSYLDNQPRHAGRVGVLGISLGAQIAAAAAGGTTGIGALVLVDGAFPDGYSKPRRALPPLHIVWGGADRVFPVSTAVELQRTAQELGGSASLDVHKGGAHDFFLKSDSQAAAAHRSAADFLLSQLSN
ncbi:dienelactone hydrolase family protein [Rhizobium sp. BK602]|uniref:dienelactone hydrolase family protein n=1 Tax=Rhizobium sp. BK602 TaxID=2586986 RepID=UPI0016195E8D|nr:dienelactone hydrolase family protein [Rhizobium sp. BK602]MBB3611266.1 dienelactone hydrolase [Rhizobium sp. BK602]